MRYLLDTNVISEVRRADCDRHVADWFASIAGRDLFVSVLTLGEIRRGVERLRRRDPPQAKTFDAWLNEFVVTFTDRIVVVDALVADVWGTLSAGDPIPVEDGLIAATAIRHSMTVATRNVMHIAPTGAAVLNPWERRGAA